VQNGLYSVTHSENGCTSDISAGYNVNLTDDIDMGNGQHVRIYPNPVSTDLTIKSDNNNLASLSISITDLQGKPVIQNSNLTQKGATLDLSGLSPGYYLLTIYNSQSNFSKTVKILKAN
jgi:hypothetical protein